MRAALISSTWHGKTQGTPRQINNPGDAWQSQAELAETNHNKF
jgi:hypothetical protein